jgi:KDO2-lipid IV(A) lauroyltransferase
MIKKQNALLLSLREQQDLYMAAANKKGVLKLQRAFKDKQLIAILPDQYPGEKGSVVSTLPVLDRMFTGLTFSS